MVTELVKACCVICIIGSSPGSIFGNAFCTQQLLNSYLVPKGLMAYKYIWLIHAAAEIALQVHIAELTHG